jgi:nucleotide-binding universal stress UspA family protein
MLKHVLVPLDGSALSERAMKYAQRIIGDGGHFTLLMAVDPPEYVSYSAYGSQTMPSQTGVPRGGMDVPSVTEDMLGQSRDYLRRLAADLHKAGYTVDMKTEVGPPADVIVGMAEDLSVEAIVMSTHGRSGLTRWILGSVTQKVIGAAPCPVFVVPPERSS